MFVLEGILNNSTVDEGELVATSTILVCCGLWEEFICLFEACGEGVGYKS